MTGEVAPGCEWARIGRYLDAPHLLKILPVSRSTLEDWLLAGKFPQPAKLGGKRFWPEIMVERYLQSQASIAPNQAAFDAAAAQSDAARKAAGSIANMKHVELPAAVRAEGDRIAALVAKQR